jgi:hypothetical protein
MRPAQYQLSLDPLELETLCRKTAPERAQVYAAAGIGFEERSRIEAAVRKRIAAEFGRAGR